MTAVTIGKTGITAEKNGFGALPIQRISKEDAVHLLRKAYDAGMTYFDTARAYTDSEEKVGEAFFGMRDKVILATKTQAKDAETFRQDLALSLEKLKTDYIDIYQFHNPPFCPKEGDGSGLYEEMEKAKAEGKIRHIGITNHRIKVAEEAIASGLYETLQFPFNYLATELDEGVIADAEKAGMGIFAMKGLSGGLITNSAAAYAFEAQYPDIVPLWGIQRERELDEFISHMQHPPVMTEELKAVIAKDRKELSGDFCRACGYCMPCPVGIEINTCARMSQLIRRSPSAVLLEKETQDKMIKIKECRLCHHCSSMCPYELDTPTLLRKNLEDYERILANGGKIID